MTLTELCAELRNYFIRDPGDLYSGRFEIVNGSLISAPYLHEGDYYRIVGSRNNDGVYQYGFDRGLTDETFVGAVWVMSVPPAVIDLVSEISEWEAATASARSTPYQSESFGGYTYSLKSGGSSDGTNSPLSWQGAFIDKLKPYRRLAVLV